MDKWVAFLNARLDEAEAGARAAGGEGSAGRWDRDHKGIPGNGMVYDGNGGIVVYDEGSPDEYQAAHIALHDPHRELREVAAKRAILDAVGYDDREGVARHFAAIWEDHPDYPGGG